MPLHFICRVPAWRLDRVADLTRSKGAHKDVCSILSCIGRVRALRRAEEQSFVPCHQGTS